MAVEFSMYGARTPMVRMTVRAAVTIAFDRKLKHRRRGKKVHVASERIP